MKTILQKWFSSPNVEHIIRLESSFPHKNPSGFHNSEINSLMGMVPGYVSYTPCRIGREGFPGEIGVDLKEFNKAKKGYLEHYRLKELGPEAQKIKYLAESIKIKADLGHTTFLSHAYVLAPFFKKHKIPFVFNLYPGGGFGHGNEGSDSLLCAISKEKYFKKVIVNSNLIRDYLLSRKIFKPNDIEVIFGVSLQFSSADFDIGKKLRFGINKETLDVCFVAYNYDGLGKSKGYDLFIAAAKELSKNKKNDCINFHVVGNFDSQTLPLDTVAARFNFYGVKPPSWLKEFYHQMDMIVCPNRPNILYTGAFDGFPMGGEAAILGVATFESDVMGVNQSGNYFKEQEFVKIGLCGKDIAKKIEWYKSNPAELCKLADLGRLRVSSYSDEASRLHRIKGTLESCIG